MKILMINKTDKYGGAAQVMQNLANGLRKNGHEVRCLVRRKFTDGDNVAELNDDLIGGALRKISGRDIPIVVGNWRDAILANDIEFGASKEIINHPWVKWAEVIHCHNLHGNYFRLDNLIELSKNKKVVWTWHDWWPYTGHCATPMNCKRYKTGCGNCPNLATYQNFLWDNTAVMWQEKRRIIKESRIVITVPSKEMQEKIPFAKLVHNGVIMGDLVNLNKVDLRIELGLPINKKIIMFLAYGWKNVDKGWNHIDKLSKAFSQDYWLGVGANKTGLIEGINYIGVVDQLTLHKYMKAADIFVFPSLAESFGMTAVEAMGQGTPIAAFPVGVVPEIIEHKKNGYIAKYDSFSDLKDGVEFILNNKINVGEIDFSINKMVKEYEKIYAKS